MTRGKKPYPPGRKKSEIIFVRVTPDQYRAYRTLGDKTWFRSLLDAEIARVPVCACGKYHGSLPCPKTFERKAL